MTYQQPHPGDGLPLIPLFQQPGEPAPAAVDELPEPTAGIVRRLAHAAVRYDIDGQQATRADVGSLYGQRGLALFDLTTTIVEEQADEPGGYVFEEQVGQQLRALEISDEAKRRRRRQLQQQHFDGVLTDGAAAAKAAMEARLVTGRELRARPRPEPIIDGLLFKDSLAWIAGDSNTYKSFLALDIALRYARGDFYHTEPHEGIPQMAQGKALIVVAEGGTGYADRISAWEAENGTFPQGNVAIHDDAVQLGDTDVAVPALISMAKEREFGLIIIDTQAMCTVGSDENSATDMGIIMNVLHQLRQASGACVLLVHHFTAGSDKGMRGSTAIYGAANTVIAVSRAKDAEEQVKLSTQAPKGKQKDAEPKELYLDLKRVHFTLADGVTGAQSLVAVRPALSARATPPAISAVTANLLTWVADGQTNIPYTDTTLAAALNELDGEKFPAPDGKKWVRHHVQTKMRTAINNALAEKAGTSYRVTALGYRSLSQYANGEE